MASSSWLGLFIVALAACNGSAAAPDGGDAPRPDGGDAPMPDAPRAADIPMNIVVTDGAVELYTDAADLGGCWCQVRSFPLGGCSLGTDSSPCSAGFCHSCLTDIGVEVDGQRLTPMSAGGTDPWWGNYGTFPPGSLSLVVGGCGHPATRIPLDGAPFPMTTAAADYVGGHPHVQWTSDAPATTTLLAIYSDFAMDLCFAETSSEFTVSYLPRASAVRVNPIVSRSEVDTEFGHATIWRAGSAVASFPP